MVEQKKAVLTHLQQEELQTERDATGMYVVCKEHVELAIDMFVDEYEDAPDVVDLKETKFSDWDPPVKCKECEKKAEFLVV
ncbi:CxxH/CxxC protein (TIGR04129 family) [Paenibacillus jamilae]|nr:CxxH/CxxC protein (TIGR04129 family) [Paenibacillus jamilae]